jgi:predicted NBD/HSP70 family sugar kinase
VLPTQLPGNIVESGVPRRDIGCQAAQKASGIPCSIANNANMIAEALLGMDRNKYSGTTAVVFMGHGIGLGLILNGSVYSGATGRAAEFGHMNHLPDGPLCRCGRHGCLEAFSADWDAPDS